MADPKPSFMSRLRMPSKVASRAPAPAAPQTALRATSAIPTQHTQIPTNNRKSPEHVKDAAKSHAQQNGRLHSESVQDAAPANNIPITHRKVNVPTRTVTPSGLKGPTPTQTSRPVLHSSSVIKTPSAGQPSSRLAGGVSTPNASTARSAAHGGNIVKRTQPSGVSNVSASTQARPTSLQETPSGTTSAHHGTVTPVSGAGDSRGGSLLGKGCTPVAAPTPSTAAGFAASHKKPNRTASLKAPSSKPTTDTKATPSSSGVVSLKNRAKSLKLPGRNRNTPASPKESPSAVTPSKRLLRKEANSQPASSASSSGDSQDRATPANEKPSAPQSLQQNGTSTNVHSTSTPQPAAPSKPRFGFGFTPRAQSTGKPTPTASPTVSGATEKERVSEQQVEGSVNKDRIQVMHFDKSPCRKTGAVAANSDLALVTDHSDVPGVVASCPADISSPLSSYEADIIQDLAPAADLESPTGSPVLPMPKKKLSFSPAPPPIGLVEASPTLSQSSAEAYPELGMKRSSLEPNSLLGPGARSSFKLSLGKSTGHLSSRSAAGRQMAQKQENVPYKVDQQRRRSGSAGECILMAAASQNPSPSTSPVMNHAPGRLKSPSQSSIGMSDSGQDISDEFSSSPKVPVSSYFRHSVSMAMRTPTTSLKDARVKALSGSTPSLSHINSAKSKAARTPTASHVVLDIETYRQMQSEIKNLKSLLLQLKRELLQEGDDTGGIPYHPPSTPDMSLVGRPVS